MGVLDGSSGHIQSFEWCPHCSADGSKGMSFWLLLYFIVYVLL